MVKSSSGPGARMARAGSGISATRGGRDFTARPQPGWAKGQPGWAKGLQQLYDDVVDEVLPAEFADLLSQLDKKSDEA